MNQKDMNLLIEIAKEIERSGGRIYFVGGSVRDELMGLPMEESKDLDTETFGLTLSELRSILSNFGPTELIGRSFKTLIIKGCKIDFALPEKTPNLSLVKACKRRDFTMNAILKDVLTGEIIDFFGGQEDIKRGIIRHINDATFIKDPLRVYRASQFAARFQFKLHPDTIQFCKKIDLSALPKERIYGEFSKLLLNAYKPSIGLRYLEELGVLCKMHPLLDQLIGCEQNPTYHPEGDVWEHTLLVVDEASKLKHTSKDPEVLMFAALLHDIAKPKVTTTKEGKIISHGHDKEGEQVAKDFLKTITNDKEFIKKVVILVKEHMKPMLFHKDREKISPGPLRKLARSVDIRELLLLCEADRGGRGEGVTNRFWKVKAWFDEKIEELKLEEDITPIITGQDLIEMGLKPGPKFSKILEQALDMQLDGKSAEEIGSAMRKLICDKV